MRRDPHGPEDLFVAMDDTNVFGQAGFCSGQAHGPAVNLFIDDHDDLYLDVVHPTVAQVIFIDQ